MKALKSNGFVKLIAALLVIALLTGCAYYAVFGVAFTVIGADDWAGAVLNMVMQHPTNQVFYYYELLKNHEGIKEEDLEDWVREELADYEAVFNPETTNFRYQITDEDGNVLFGNYEGGDYIARSYNWEQRFVGTDLDRERLNAYDRGIPFDYETGETIPAQGTNRYPIPEGQNLQKKYVTYDENGYLYSDTNEPIGRIANYSDLLWHLSEVGETLADGTVIIDGVEYWPIDPADGFPEEFAYISEYDKIFDEDFNFIMYVDDYAGMTIHGGEYFGESDVGIVYHPIDRNANDYPSNFAYYDDYGNFYDWDYNCVAHQGDYPMVESTPAPKPVTQAVTVPDSEANFDIKPKVVDMPKAFTQADYDKLYDDCWTEYAIRGYIPKEMAIDDVYHQLYMRVVQYDEQKQDNLDMAMGFGIGGLVLLAVLLLLAGKRDEDGICVAAGLGKLPWDLWLIAMGCLAFGAVLVVALAANIIMEGLYYYIGSEIAPDNNLVDLVIKGCTAVAAICITCLVGCLHSLAARVKVKGWWRNCLCWKAFLWCWKLCVKIVKWCRRLWLRIWRGGKKTMGSIPLIWKAVVVLGIVCIVEMVFCCMIYSSMAVVGILLSILKFILCVAACLEMKGLQQGAKIIADGDLNHRIDTKNLHGDFKAHAECLNRIGDGLSHSVDAQLRSERMKTELITNVSHDLKTPLTSIVNYVDLLKKEELTGTAAEYVEVLDRQSARLKKLTEDLVEASKASSGALTVTTERVSLTELLEQARAEYAVRLEEIGLQSIVRQSDGDVTVWADGKYVWRILDNLLGNVRKYAMPNTRVYLELRKEGEYGVLSVKNMSRESLNISAEELMERFVRGDSSRNTEGSGLGLSIAQSLAKLMGGEVRITIDGDLFKADVLLPLAK